MNITEYATKHNQQPQTIKRYIDRHPQLFGGHTQKLGKSIILDDDAISLLDQKYPVPKPVQIIQGIPMEEHLSVLSEKDNEIQRLQTTIINLQQALNNTLTELYDSRSNTLLLESKMDTYELQLAHINEDLKRSNTTIDMLTQKINAIKKANLIQRILQKY